jgi:hypothetical protein
VENTDYRKIVSLSAMRHPIPQSEADKIGGLVYVLLWFLDQEASGTRDPGSDSHFGILKSMAILSTFLVECYGYLNASEIIMEVFCSDPNNGALLSRYCIQLPSETSLFSPQLGILMAFRP